MDRWPSLPFFHFLPAVLWSTGQRYAFWKNIDNLPDVRERTAQILADIRLTGVKSTRLIGIR